MCSLPLIYRSWLLQVAAKSFFQGPWGCVTATRRWRLSSAVLNDSACDCESRAVIFIWTKRIYESSQTVTSTSDSRSLAAVLPRHDGHRIQSQQAPALYNTLSLFSSLRLHAAAKVTLQLSMITNGWLIEMLSSNSGSFWILKLIFCVWDHLFWPRL